MSETGLIVSLMLWTWFCFAVGAYQERHSLVDLVNRIGWWIQDRVRKGRVHGSN